MAEQDAKNGGFTKEQLEALQLDAALGGDIPLIGLAGSLGRKGAVKTLEAAEPYLKKAGHYVQEVFVEAKAAYLERAVAKEAAEAAELASMRISVRPLKELIQDGIDAGKVAPQNLDNTKGADLFVKNIKELDGMLNRDELRQYAKLALEDEKTYRETLSPVAKWARSFHYDNANPEVGYLVGPSRYGGTWMTHLKGAAAESDMQEIGIMALNALRGGAQVIGLSAAGVKVAVGAEVEQTGEQQGAAGTAMKTGAQQLSAALEANEALRGPAIKVMAMVEQHASLLKQNTPSMDWDAYVDAAKHKLAVDIETGGFKKSVDSLAQVQRAEDAQREGSTRPKMPEDWSQKAAATVEVVHIERSLDTGLSR